MNLGSRLDLSLNNFIAYISADLLTIGMTKDLTDFMDNYSQPYYKRATTIAISQTRAKPINK